MFEFDTNFKYEDYNIDNRQNIRYKLNQNVINPSVKARKTISTLAFDAEFRLSVYPAAISGKSASLSNAIFSTMSSVYTQKSASISNGSFA